MIDREFIPYPEALGLKQLGFQERCFGHYWENLFYFKTTFNHPSTMPNSPESCLAPTYSQAFRWFREKHYVDSYIGFKKDTDKEFSFYYYQINWTKGFGFETYEEAELACLKKLIEIVKQSKSDE
jgi:hypothetical protein